MTTQKPIDKTLLALGLSLLYTVEQETTIEIWLGTGL